MNAPRYIRIPLIGLVLVLGLVMVLGVVWVGSLYAGPDIVQANTLIALTMNYHSRGLGFEPFRDQYLFPDEFRESDLIALEFGEFYAQVQGAYKYTSDEYDCKYWALIWGMWLMHHPPEHTGFGAWQFVTGPDHVFVIAHRRSGSGYCVLDGRTVECMG